ncbi:hypothetical protein MMC07_009592 [Pseudocyphellaria aurata]|nr:hypothetical protein [Pseudocyphellaria aurata]
MCKLPYVSCKNRNCDGIAQYHPLLPCDKRPHCQIEQVRVPGITLVPYCSSCAGQTREQRNAQTAQARKEKFEAAEAQRARRVTSSAQAGQPQAQSSATGPYTDGARYLLGAYPSNETIYAPRFQYGTDPQFGFPHFTPSSHASAPGFLPSLPNENIPVYEYPYGFPTYPASSSSELESGFRPGSEKPLFHPQGIAPLSNPASESQNGMVPPFIQYPAISSQAPASGFLPGPENSFSPPQKTEPQSNPAPRSQYGTDPQFSQQGTGTPLTPPRGIAGDNFETYLGSPPIDPVQLHADILHDNGINPQDRRAAQQLLQPMGLWPHGLY